MSIPDTDYIELFARKHRVERELVSVIWGCPKCWLYRLAEAGLSPCDLDDETYQLAWEAAKFRDELGLLGSEDLLVRLIRFNGLYWEDLDRQHLLWRYGPRDADRRGEMVMDELIDLAPRLDRARRAYADYREALGWPRPTGVTASSKPHPGRAAAGWKQTKALPSAKGVRHDRA